MTRDDLVIMARTKILSDIISDGAREGRPLDFNIDRHLHALLRESDELQHRNRNELTPRLGPRWVKRKP